MESNKNDIENVDMIKCNNSYVKLWKKFARKEITRVKLEKIRKKHKKGQLSYTFDYLLEPKNICRFVKQSDLLKYCDERRNTETNGEKPNFADNSRQIEKMRKDLYPLQWLEVIKNGDLYFMFYPELKNVVSTEIYEHHKHKSDGFTKAIIKKKMEETNYKCEITGLANDNGALAADHFIPKEKGGTSDETNCIILNKILNEKKNKNNPIEWFCNTLLSNFMNICKKVGIIEECKIKLLEFINNYE